MVNLKPFYSAKIGVFYMFCVGQLLSDQSSQRRQQMSPGSPFLSLSLSPIYIVQIQHCLCMTEHYKLILFTFRLTLSSTVMLPLSVSS